MTAVDLAGLLAAGLAAHQAGRLAEAEAAYRAVLAQVPGHSDALHLLAVVALQRGQAEDAVGLARRALAAAPEQPTYWNLLGVAERAGGRLDAAAGCFGRAVALAPGYADGWANLAAVHEQRGEAAAEEAALAGLVAVLAAPGAAGVLARAWGRRGVLAYQRGELVLAADCFGRAVALAPEDAEAWGNLGAAQLGLGQLSEAEASQREAVRRAPGSAVARNNLGNALVARGQWAAAEAELRVAVQLAPGEASGWANLGHALKGLERHAEAAEAYERALHLAPGLVAAQVGLGDALQGIGAPERALGWYERALQLAPADPDTHEHRGIALQRLGRLEEAAAAFRACLALDPDRPRVHSGLIFVLDLQERAEAEAQQERACWSARFGQVWRQRPAAFASDPDPERPLRVGYVSADFRHHSAGFLALPIVREHDRTRISVACYSGVTEPDQLTEQFQALADVWHDVADLSDDDLEALIRADQIDVLVDLSGHSAGNRLPVFGRKPAPVQVTAWGYATGTGLDAIDAFLADPIVVPPEARASYAEAVLDLPSVICYEPPPGAPPVAPAPVAMRGYPTFGAFNRLAKATPAVRDTWARILAAVPGARLLVKTGPQDTDVARRALVEDLAARGIDPDRIELRPPTTHLEHLAAHGEIDILLDTFPHTGGVTTVEALLMGVPIVTLLGDRVAGRLSASFLTTLGRGELVATTPDEYVEIAARLAGDPERLARERATLRERLLGSPITDAARYTRAVEDVYRALWRRWCRQITSSHAPGRAVSPPVPAAVDPGSPFTLEMSR